MARRGGGAYVRDPPGEGPTSPAEHARTGMKSNLKWYAMRATLTLGTMAAAWGFMLDSGRRWL